MKPVKPVNPRRQRLWRDLALIVIAPLLLYLLACLFTYSPADPGFDRDSSLLAPLHNVGGAVGASGEAATHVMLPAWPAASVSAACSTSNARTDVLLPAASA